MKIVFQNSESVEVAGKEFTNDEGKVLTFTITRREKADNRKDSEALPREMSGKICVSFGDNDWMRNGRVWTGNLITHCAPRVSPSGAVMVKCQGRKWFAVPTETHYTAITGKTYVYNSWTAVCAE